MKSTRFLVHRSPDRVRGLTDGVQQVLVPDRFGEEFHRAGLHRPDAHRDVPMPGDEDVGMGLSAGELALKVESAEPGQTHVEDEAGRGRPAACTGAIRGRTEGLDRQANRPEEAAERVRTDSSSSTMITVGSWLPAGPAALGRITWSS